MPRNKIIPYDPWLKEKAQYLRKNSTLSEVLLWQQIKNRKLGIQFHRQVPISHYIVDFYCHEIKLAIEIDGNSHDLPERQDKDYQRQKHLEKLGVHFIRIDDLDVKNNLDNVLGYLTYQINKLNN